MQVIVSPVVHDLPADHLGLLFCRRSVLGRQDPQVLELADHCLQGDSGLLRVLAGAFAGDVACELQLSLEVLQRLGEHEVLVLRLGRVQGFLGCRR